MKLGKTFIKKRILTSRTGSKKSTLDNHQKQHASIVDSINNNDISCDFHQKQTCDIGHWIKHNEISLDFHQKMHGSMGHWVKKQ